jgi:hypothetical protein
VARRGAFCRRRPSQAVAPPPPAALTDNAMF